MNAFRFTDIAGNELELIPGKAVCVGRNYLKHIEELNNEVAPDCVLFIKPASSFQTFSGEIQIPGNKGMVHHELELAILIGSHLKDASEEYAMAAIDGYGIALDLTLRELQGRLKQKGLPWEKAKAFDGSCPITPFVLLQAPWQPHTIELKVNGNSRQLSSTDQMLTSVAKLISEISHWFSLSAGDIVLTGTPEGVAALNDGDELEVILDNQYHWKSKVRV